MYKFTLLAFLLLLCVTPAAAKRPDYLSIPAIDFYLPVGFVAIEGSTWNVDSLDTGIAYLDGTSQLGQSGNIAITGHDYAAFQRLDQLALGDMLILTNGTLDSVYRVTEIKTVDKAQVWVVYPTETDKLTLITCVGDQRLVIVGVRVWISIS